MREYKDKETGKVEKADSFTKEFAFSHNSNWELLEQQAKEPTVQELKSKLTELNIEFKSNASKKELLELLNQYEEQLKETSEEDEKCQN